MANIGFTFCRMCDRMISRYLEKLEEEFVKHGGIKERMYAARTSYRKAEVERLQRLLSAAGIKY